MNSRYPIFDIQHQRNSRYEPSTLEAETCWPREAVDLWIAVCEGTVVEKVRTTLSGATIRGIGERLTGTRPVDATTIQDLTLKLGAQQEAEK